MLLQVPTAWFDKCVCVTECVFFSIAVRAHVFGNVSFLSFFLYFSVLVAKQCKTERCYCRNLLIVTMNGADAHVDRQRSTQLGYLKVPFPKEMC